MRRRDEKTRACCRLMKQDDEAIMMCANRRLWISLFSQDLKSFTESLLLRMWCSASPSLPRRLLPPTNDFGFRRSSLIAGELYVERAEDSVASRVISHCFPLHPSSPPPLSPACPSLWPPEPLWCARTRCRIDCSSSSIDPQQYISALYP